MANPSASRLPIHRAAEEGDLNALQAELDKGVYVELKDATDNNCTALHHAVWEGHLEAVKMLVKRKANIEAACFTSNMTALHFACRAGHIAIAELLLDVGADVNKANVRGTTPLMDAAHVARKPSLVAVLLARKANTSLRDNSGRTALDMAKALEQNGIPSEIAEMLRVNPAPPAPPAPMALVPVAATTVVSTKASDSASFALAG